MKKPLTRAKIVWYNFGAIYKRSLIYVGIKKRATISVARLGRYRFDSAARF